LHGIGTELRRFYIGWKEPTGDFITGLNKELGKRLLLFLTLITDVCYVTVQVKER
jgi:hypothetical protein